MKSREKEYFQRIAEVFDTHFNVYTKPAGILRVQRRNNLFSEHCCLKPGLRVLEIGCGTGEYTKGLLRSNCNLFSIDLSYNMLNKAREKIPNRGNLCFIVSDAERLPFKDEVFDAVIGNAVLHHLDIKQAVGQIWRVLKPGGSFVFSEPNMLNPQIFLQKNIRTLKRLFGDSPEEGAFFRWQVKELFLKTGFKDIKVEPFDFLHPHCPNFFLKSNNKIGRFLERLFLIKEIAGSLLIKGKK